ncbi:hypothetical protein HPB47_002117 [Ixodes persulcatus]|uniref:Uncharacterized protein n=1 Tax=Ixodes persulcatus TaxID=34615 RepID=A0AC60PMG2_IXOPE|nr:hypothetical protein HPB47_002117 [Ixodes persulcatus]
MCACRVIFLPRCARDELCVCARASSSKKKREGRRRTENGVCSSGQTSVWKGTAGRPDPGSSRLPPGLTSSSHEAFTPVESRCTCCGARVKTTAAHNRDVRTYCASMWPAALALRKWERATLEPPVAPGVYPTQHLSKTVRAASQPSVCERQRFIVC